MSELAALEAALGWRFSEPARLVEALTHATYANENAGAGPDNQRLEFLGDAVLGLLVSRLLYERVAGEEGELSRRRARVVRREALATLGRELDLGPYLRLGAGQKRAGPDMRVLADAFEAVAGAVFLDGDFEAVERCFGPRFVQAIDEATESIDWKTELQEVTQARGLGVPRYVVVEVSGPDHARHYRCEVVVGAEVLGSGDGSSKKVAEQQCARAALARLEER